MSNEETSSGGSAKRRRVDDAAATPAVVIPALTALARRAWERRCREACQRMADEHDHIREDIRSGVESLQQEAKDLEYAETNVVRAEQALGLARAYLERARQKREATRARQPDMLLQQNLMKTRLQTEAKALRTSLEAEHAHANPARTGEWRLCVRETRLPRPHCWGDGEGMRMWGGCCGTFFRASDRQTCAHCTVSARVCEGCAPHQACPVCGVQLCPEHLQPHMNTLLCRSKAEKTCGFCEVEAHWEMDCPPDQDRNDGPPWILISGNCGKKLGEGEQTFRCEYERGGECEAPGTGGACGAVCCRECIWSCGGVKPDNGPLSGEYGYTECEARLCRACAPRSAAGTTYPLCGGYGCQTAEALHASYQSHAERNPESRAAQRYMLGFW